MDDTPPPPPSLTNAHTIRAHTNPPHAHNIEISTSTSSTLPSVYPTPPLTANPTSGEHDRSSTPPPAVPAATSTNPLTTSEILTHLLPFLLPVPIPVRWDLGDDAALRDMFVRLLGDPALFALRVGSGSGSGDSGAGAGAGGSFADERMGKAKGKGKERATDAGAENPNDIGGKGVGDEKDASEVSQGRSEYGREEGRRNERAERVEVDVEDEDTIMHDPTAVLPPSSSSSCLETTPKSKNGHTRVLRGRSSTRKPRVSKDRMEKNTFSPVDWSKVESKTRESSRTGVRVLSLSPHAKLILNSPSPKGSGPAGVGPISPLASLHASTTTSTVPPAKALLQSRSSSSLSFHSQSPHQVSRSYTLPPQPEGSIAALREVALGMAFTDQVVFGIGKNAGGSGGMDMDAGGDGIDSERMSSSERQSESESEESSGEEQKRDNDVVLGGDGKRARRDEGEKVEEEKVVPEPEPTDGESRSMSAPAQHDHGDGDGAPQMPAPVQTSLALAEVGRTTSGMSSSSLSTLTSLPSSTDMSSRAESPKNAVITPSTSTGCMPIASTSASENGSGSTRKTSPLSSAPSSMSTVSSSASSLASSLKVIDLKNVKFGPLKKNSRSRLSLSPVKSSLSPSKRTTPMVSTPPPAKQKTPPSTSETPFVASQSSQTTVDEESIAQDLIMTESPQQIEYEQEDIDQFSSLVPSSKDGGEYDDISMGTSLGSRAVGVDSQSQIESANETSPRRRRMDLDEVEVDDVHDRAGSDPSSCSPPTLKKKRNEDEQIVAQTPLLAEHSSPLFTSSEEPLHRHDADEGVPMEDVNDDQDIQSHESPSKDKSQSANHSPSQPRLSLSGLSEMTTEIVRVKRELNSPVSIPAENGDEYVPSASPRAKRAKLTRQPSSSQRANRRASARRNSVITDIIDIDNSPPSLLQRQTPSVRTSAAEDKKGKGKNVVKKKSVPADDVISISSDSEDEIVETMKPKFKEKGKEKEKATPAAIDPTPSQQKTRPKPVPVKRKPVAKLNVFEKPSPEIVDLTTPVKEPPKPNPKEKEKEEMISPPPSPLTPPPPTPLPSPSSSVKRTRNSRMLVDDEGPMIRAARRDVAEAEAGVDQEQEQEQVRTRRTIPAKVKAATPLAIKKYAARLAAEADDSDDAEIISVKKKPTKKPAGTIVKRDPDEEGGGVPPDAGDNAGKTRLMGILAGKAKQSGATTRVKKRKRTPDPSLDEDVGNDNDDEFSKPPLKRAKVRNGSTVPATASAIKGKERGKSKPLSKVKTESVKEKEKEAEPENRYLFRSPRKESSLGGIASASVSTPRKKRAQPVVWPKVENPNFDLFVNCDLCDKWYHIGCVGMDPEDVRLRETEVYRCPLCDAGVAKEKSPVKNTPSKEDHTDPKSRCSRRSCLRPAIKKHRGRKGRKSQAEIQAMKNLEETFDVEAFVGRHKKVVGGQGISYEYLVKWLNYDYSEATWETISQMGLTNPATLLEQFEHTTADEGIDLENAGNVVLLKAAAEAGWTEDKTFVKPQA